MTIPLWKRRATVVVGNITFECGVNEGGVTGLDVDFHVKKTLRATPNECELRIYNLNASHRAQLAQRRHHSRGNVLVLEAGYEEDDFLIFAGDILECESERDGGTYTTVITAGDGHRARRTARVSATIPGGTTAAGLVREVARPVGAALGFGQALVDRAAEYLGNLAQAMPESTPFAGGAATVRTSTAVSGNAMAELHRICRSIGYEVSIQDSVLQFVRHGQPTTNEAIRLSPESGVVKAPIRNSKGIVEARTLLIPDLLPGRKVQFDGYETRGAFRVESAVYTGKTDGTEWFIDVECKDLTAA